MLIISLAFKGEIPFISLVLMLLRSSYSLNTKELALGTQTYDDSQPADMSAALKMFLQDICCSHLDRHL